MGPSVEAVDTEAEGRGLSCNGMSNLSLLTLNSGLADGSTRSMGNYGLRVGNVQLIDEPDHGMRFILYVPLGNTKDTPERVEFRISVRRV